MHWSWLTRGPSVVMATLRKLVSVFFHVGLCNVIEPMRNVRFISQYFSFSSPLPNPEKSKRVFRFNYPYYNNLFWFGVWVQWQACYSSLSCLIVSRWGTVGGGCCRRAPVVLTWAVWNYSLTFSSWFTICSTFWYHRCGLTRVTWKLVA